MDCSGYTIEAVESAPFGQVAYVLWREGAREALVVDPGFETDPVVELLQSRGLGLAAILNTHGHVDHIAGNASLKRAFPSAPLIIGRDEAPMLGDPEANLSAPFGVALTSPPADRVVEEGEPLEVGGFRFEVREIPGHSPGSVVYVCDEFDPPFVLGGDVLFAGSVGRTDLGGNAPQLFAGIKAKLFSLPDATVVLPGHGPPTTVGHEKRTNPFVGENAGYYRLS